MTSIEIRLSTRESESKCHYFVLDIFYARRGIAHKEVLAELTVLSTISRSLQAVSGSKNHLPLLVSEGDLDSNAKFMDPSLPFQH